MCLRLAEYREDRTKIDDTVRFSKKVAKNTLNRDHRGKWPQGRGLKSHDELPLDRFCSFFSGYQWE